MRKIRNKFLIIFLVIGLVPLIVMGIVAITSVSQTHRVDIASLELQLLNQKREEIEKFLDETIGIIQIQLGYEQTVEISPKDQVFLLNSLLETNAHLQEVAFINMQGKETQKIIRDFEESPVVELLNVSALPRFQTAKTGQDYIGKVYYTTSGPMLGLAAAVKNKNGIVVMVLSAELNLTALQAVAEKAQLGNEGYFFVTDQNGKLLAHSRKNLYTPQLSLPNHPLAASVLKGETRSGLESRDRFESIWDKDVIGAGIPLSKTGWALLVEWPTADAFLVIKQINRQLYIISGAAFLSILFITFWVAGKVSKPIRVLKEGAKIIGAGKFDYHIQIDTKDEIQELGDSFNIMARDLANVEQLREQAIRAESLEKSLEKEKELSRNKDAFIGNASHQLRTPLTSLSWSLESAQTDAEKIKPELGATLKGALDGIKNLNEIVNDLLGVSEFGMNYREEKREACNMEPYINEVGQSFASQFESKKITYSFLKEGSPEKAYTNPVAIKKALTYLFDNACIYAKSVLKVTLRQNGEEVVVAFQDDGIGIPEDDKSLIFTQFFRAKNAIVKKNVGTGLGLFITHNIMQGLDGRIWFESQENQGTTVYISVPTKPKGASPLPSAPATSPSAPSSPYPTTELTALTPISPVEPPKT